MNRQDTALVELLKERQQKKKLSLRKISNLAGIDVSTLSRIFNQKQKPQIKHLEKLAEVLDVSLAQILTVAGYDLEGEEVRKSEDVLNLHPVGTDWFAVCKTMEAGRMTTQIEQELEGYSQYMKVDEGMAMIENNLDTKLKSISQIGPVIDRVKQLYDYIKKPELPIAMYLMVGSALLYFIIASDVIPDFIFPLGFVDDTIAISLIWEKIKSFL